MKFIMKQSINDLCRLCSKTTESIQHLSSGCSYLAPREYTTRHNLVCGIIHQAIYNSLFSKPSSVPYYQYKPQKIIENDKAKIYWDVSVISDTNIPHNRPDIVVFRKKEKTALIIDVTVPLDDNIQTGYVEKIAKYQVLKEKLATMYQLRTVQILPMVLSSNGLIHCNFFPNLKLFKIEHPMKVLVCSQKSVILSTTSMLRRYLNVNEI
uniref:Reverse transcriptase n=1 Tax=Cacopsylla melanoneura TaxID=428564 RepID=A0A8D8Y6P4_9HEMI